MLRTLPSGRLQSMRDWVSHVETTDPVRRVMGQGFAWVSSIFLVLTVVVVVTIPLEPMILAMNLTIFSLELLAFWLNRRGLLAGAIILTIIVSIGITTSITPESYMSTSGDFAISIGVAIPIIVGTLFVGWHAGLIILVYQGAFFAINAVTYGHRTDLIVVYVVLYGIYGLATFALAAITSGFYRRAIRDAAELTTSLERRVADRTAALAASNRALQDAAHARSHAFQAIVHDLNNGLNRLAAIAFGLRDGDTPEDAAHLLDSATHDFTDFSGLLLSLALAEDGQLPLQRVLTDLGDLVQRVGEAMQPVAAQVGLRLTVSGVGCAAVDTRQIKRVLQNIIGNALKYTDDGGVHVTVEDDPAAVRIVVTDTGHGIAPDDLAKLGSYLARVGDTTKRQGTGIGLYASAKLVEAHGGTIHYTSAGVGLGTTVTITLPKEAPHA